MKKLTKNIDKLPTDVPLKDRERLDKFNKKSIIRDSLLKSSQDREFKRKGKYLSKGREVIEPGITREQHEYRSPLGKGFLAIYTYKDYVMVKNYGPDTHMEKPWHKKGN